MTTTPRNEVPRGAGIARTLSERKRLVTGVFAAFVALGLALNAFTPPVYRATVRVEFPRTSEQTPWTGEKRPDGNFQSENMALFTSAELITNRVLLSRLVGDLDRAEPVILARAAAEKKRAQTFPLFRVPSASATGANALAGPDSRGVEADPVAFGERIKHLERSITVEPVADTRLVDIRVEDSDPVIARETADRLARLFVEWQQQRHASTDTSGLTFVMGEIAAVKERIEATSAKLARLTTPRTRVDHVRTPVTTGGASSSSSLLRDLQRAESELAGARGTYREAHPKVQELSAQVRTLRNQLAGTPRPGTGTHWETRAVRTVVPAPRQAVLENDLAVDEALYARLVARAREIGIDQQMTYASTVNVVEPASVDPDPIRPRPLVNLAVCLLAGGIVAIGLALLLGSSNRMIRGASDAEELTGLPVLAVLPKRA